MGVASLLGARAGPAGPGWRATGVLALACAAVIGGGAWLGWSLLGSRSPATTFADAYRFLGQPLRLSLAQDVAWRFAVQDVSGLAARTSDLLAPPLPPFLCAAGLASPTAERAEASSLPARPGNGTGAGTAASALDRAVRQAARAATLGDRAALAQAAATLGREGRGLSGYEGQVTRYSLALTLAAGHDWAGATTQLAALPLAQPRGGSLPVVSAATAARGAQSGGAPRFRVLLAFHIRYLAGVSALNRDAHVEAIGHFRRALNVVNYALGDASSARRGGHYERIDMRPGPLSCAGPAQLGLTSLDAYAGLVAAYMAALDFRDPERLAAEVGRQGFEVDPGDPLAPLLRHAQAVARGRRSDRNAIPEHVIWASSNLQRVYHHNRLRPDPRLAATRAVVTLRLLDDPAWSAALDLEPEERCDMLAEVAAGLRQDGAAMGAASARAVPVGGAMAKADSAWAAVAVHAFARLEARCPDASVQPVEGAVRDRWLDLAGGFLHAGLVARYERLRKALEAGPGAGGPPGGGNPLDAAAAVLDQAESDARFFRRGRVPPDLSAAVDPVAAREFAARWRTAVFRDVARQLVDHASPGASLSRIRARDAAEYATTVNDAVAHAGLGPSDVYRWEALAPLLRSQGGGAWTHRLRYHARSQPRLAAAAVLLLVAVGLAATVLVFVNVWRFALLTRIDFYRDEAVERARLPSAGSVAP